MDPNYLIVTAACVAGVIGHFIGYRSGWADCAKKVREDAEKAVSSAVSAAHHDRLPVGMPPSTQAKVPAPVSIGDRFTYMGLQMLCVSHSIRMPLGVMAPGMSAEYVDVDGLVRGHYWTPEQYGALRAELARRGQGPA